MDEEITRSKSPDEIYCPECGKTVKKDAVVCVNCGVQLKELKVSQPISQSIQTPRPSPVSAPSINAILEEGNFQLRGIRGFYWFFLVAYTMAYIAGTISLIFMDYNKFGYPGFYRFITLIIISAAYIVMLALYIIPLVGIIRRKPFSVPFTRAMLIVSMFNFPVGTIIGGVLWKRINDSSAKKYLNHNG